ncbi:DUF1670 domain-containing protein [Chloroflexi bacterium TSY]|nr:DUF1670 domain-containing protein [Chloroflexi bacterium TSY]
MEEQGRIERQGSKTEEAHLLSQLEKEFEFAPRIAQAIVEEAQAVLSRPLDELGRGQIWVYLVSRKAGHGKSLRETETKAVRWTVDAGAEEQEVLAKHGRVAQRQVRIQRLVSEAEEQGALASQEDLAHVLHVTVRTIKRDCKELQGQGIWLPLRGNVRGIGRGQSHKALIIRSWLKGETYDQLERSTKHTVISIRRYIQTFLRVVELEQSGFGAAEIAHLTQCGLALVEEYLTIYHECHDAVSRSKLQEELERFRRSPGSFSGKKRRNQ